MKQETGGKEGEIQIARRVLIDSGVNEGGRW